MRVAIIGAGLQARRRAPAIKKLGDELVVVCSAHEETARKFAEEMGCDYSAAWDKVITREDIDAVVVCTPPSTHAPISIAAMNEGKHVLCEKPLAKDSEEAKRMLAAAKENSTALKCGFNHRYHPSLIGIKNLIKKGELGDVFYIRANYGIGARVGYEREWRVDSRFVSGGQLMEQGIHLVDLARWYLGEFFEVFAMTANFYLKTEPFEDNAFVSLRTFEGRIAFIHASLTTWKNTFRLEVFGSDGYAISSGLGGSYGTETLSYGRREPNRPFTEHVTEFRGEDPCWTEEWREFKNLTETPSDTSFALDGLKALQIIEKAYESAKLAKIVTISVQ